MKKGILKKQLSAPRWKHVVSPIPKGTEVEYSIEKSSGKALVKHPTKDGITIMCEVEKYF